MNIQFMTPEKNGIWTEDMGLRWNGEKRYQYVPDFDEMIENALCDGEIAAIERSRDLVDRGVEDGFAFEIVFTAYEKRTGKWTVLQHPWEVNPWDGTQYSREHMLREIKRSLEHRDSPYTAWI